MPRLFLAAAFLLLLAPAEADAQLRYGVGFDVIGGIAADEVISEGPALGLRGRVSRPVNADFSFAGSLGFAGYLFGGRDDASYLLTPQAEAILTLPGVRSVDYVMGGVGAYLPFGDGPAAGGPSIHVGIGWARPLAESSFYLEINPALVIGSEKTGLALPIRAGVIF